MRHLAKKIIPRRSRKPGVIFCNGTLKNELKFREMPALIREPNPGLGR
jgi:hypothetical protein